MADYTVVSTISSGLTVNNGDDVSVISGGTLSNTDIASGGTVVVYSGATADFTNVSSGGTLVLLPGAESSGTTSAAFADVYSGRGFVEVSGSQVIDVAGGGVEFSNISSGDTAFVMSGSFDLFLTVSGGTIFVDSSGTIIDTQISAGYVIVSSGGVANDTYVSTGGTLIVLPGADVANTNSTGGTVISTGVVVMSETINTSAEVSSGASLTDPDISSGQVAYVLSNGSITGGTDHGTFDVFSTGVVSGSLISGTANVYSGGTDSGVTIGNGGTENIYAGGGAVDDNIASGGTEYVLSGGSATGTDVGNGGFLYVASAGIIDFTNTQIASGGGVDLAGLAYDPDGSTSYDSGTETLQVTDNGTTVTFENVGSFVSNPFIQVEDALGGTIITTDGTPCYCRGTRILTDRGEVAVEHLAIGHRLITAHGAARPIRWIGRRAYAGRFAAQNRDVLPIVIRQGALSDGVPKRDLYVSPLHALFLDGVLIPARALINGGSIAQTRAVETVEYFHLELETHDVILAEGAAAESFLDDRNRCMFQNAAQYRALYPEAAASPPVYCAQRVEAGPVVDAIRSHFATRSEMLGYVIPGSITASLGMGTNLIQVPAGIAELRLICNFTTPPGDQRCLGALITRFTLEDQTIDLTDTRLAAGFHPAETHAGDKVRWTNGNAVVELDSADFARWCRVEVSALAERNGLEESSFCEQKEAKTL